jgi:2'-5' RNA ligase
MNQFGVQHFTLSFHSQCEPNKNIMQSVQGGKSDDNKDEIVISTLMVFNRQAHCRVCWIGCGISFEGTWWFIC